jgi:hypothetical protein
VPSGFAQSAFRRSLPLTVASFSTCQRSGAYFCLEKEAKTFSAVHPLYADSLPLAGREIVLRVGFTYPFR